MGAWIPIIGDIVGRMVRSAVVSAETSNAPKGAKMAVALDTAGRFLGACGRVPPQIQADPDFVQAKRALAQAEVDLENTLVALYKKHGLTAPEQ